MSTVAPNTPTTSWIKDNGTTISITTDVLIDESGNFFVDESGNNLLDTVSTDGNAPAHSWNEDDAPTTSWSNSFVVTSTARRITISNDVRVTISGDTRVSNVSNQNKKPNTSWSEDEY
jgi:ribonuclease BN (tRNA processing enzyme)